MYVSDRNFCEEEAEAETEEDANAALEHEALRLGELRHNCTYERTFMQDDLLLEPQ